MSSNVLQVQYLDSRAVDISLRLKIRDNQHSMINPAAYWERKSTHWLFTLYTQYVYVV